MTCHDEIWLCQARSVEYIDCNAVKAWADVAVQDKAEFEIQAPKC